MITYNEFVQDIMNLVEECPSFWRKGQCVFNIVDSKYGAARTVQFTGIDCFYDDSKIDEFLQKSYEVLKELQENH